MATRRSRERYGNRPSPSSDRSVARPATGERREQMPRNQKHLGILAGPERRWRREDHANGMGIDLLHLPIGALRDLLPVNAANKCRGIRNTWEYWPGQNGDGDAKITRTVWESTFSIFRSERCATCYR